MVSVTLLSTPETVRLACYVQVGTVAVTISILIMIGLSIIIIQKTF